MAQKPGIRTKPRTARKAKAELRVSRHPAHEDPIAYLAKVSREREQGKVARWLASLFRRLLGRA